MLLSANVNNTLTASLYCGKFVNPLFVDSGVPKVGNCLKYAFSQRRYFIYSVLLMLLPH